MKSKNEFIEQMHDKVFQAWWKDNEQAFQLVHTSDAKKIFIAGRICFEKQFMKQKSAIQKVENKARKIQSKFDKLNKEEK